MLISKWISESKRNIFVIFCRTIFEKEKNVMQAHKNLSDVYGEEAFKLQQCSELIC